ncbi:hypothetical protein Ae406Ps2_5610 [Pseudonocardia sp. Ae406_Ps2]|uniref:hypothetical protein n=1 Tax=unclassified Pseudonocardia TaxID=2619320 RepID=UPI00094B60AF|nr:MULTISPECIES: hypothetical protein [unclassified Pseudonocardia]OLL96682.1 hypothetical protein Ae331Ps2_0349c [Pseudonocardia sp. Ae331_Ps2]OLM05610.1 hypothetical protein Ae406Ps2_5610 [Pseudonocardia sp. Ae406_Ps2]OLM15441.1 hypothetical protein Ae505Ps2_5573c [Pseudonocardia sp. Ae505_Ps2]OLM27185.1 hypothetical protein Ae706Ps2_5619 [Pseudonocardia sp. Ae706_Ps2]OLM32715.1 hypothetical protein Ae717Ps2_3611c [Pseudonocardia sp. Ae717_Ps2]
MTTECPAMVRLSDAIGRTVAAGTARATLLMDLSGTRAMGEALPRRRRPLPALARAVLRRVPRQVVTRGVLDLARRRAMAGHDHIAFLQIDDQVWSGRPGRRLDTLGLTDPGRIVTPLAAFDRLAEVTEAVDHGVVPDRGERWRRLTVTTADGEPGEVWLDGAHVRRIRLPEQRQDSTTVTLDAFGTDVDDRDWTRLPG